MPLRPTCRRASCRLLCVVPVALLATAGCVPKSVSQPLTDRDPVFVIPAVIDAADAEDPQQLHQLVELLDSTDPAVRLAAVEALRQRTGKNFGYRFYDDEAARSEPAAKWKAHVEELVPR